MSSVIDVERYQAFRAIWLDLSPQQRRAIEGRCRGLTNNEVGDELFIAGQTVKNHLTIAFKRLHQVARGSRTGSQGAMTAICWCIGYEAALQDIEHTIASRKRAA